MRRTRVLCIFASLLLVCISLAGCTGNGIQSAHVRGIEAVPLNTRTTGPEAINEGAVIPFEHALPAQNVDGRHNGTYNNVELAIPVYKNWIRDHVHTMKAFRHWEHNLRAYLDFTLAYQRADGSYYELIKQMDDRHWAYVAEDDVFFFPEDNLYLARLDIEADVEYLVVEGAAGIAAWGSLPDGQ